MGEARRMDWPVAGPVLPSQRDYLEQRGLHFQPSLSIGMLVSIATDGWLFFFKNMKTSQESPGGGKRSGMSISYYKYPSIFSLGQGENYRNELASCIGLLYRYIYFFRAFKFIPCSLPPPRTHSCLLRIRSDRRNNSCQLGFLVHF